MKNRIVSALAALFLVVPALSGQSVADSEWKTDSNGYFYSDRGTFDSGWDIFQDYVSDEPDLNQEELDQFEDLLEQYRNSPININTATQADLQQLPFLTEAQIEDIHAYIYYNGAMATLGELQLTGSLDYRTRRLLELFVYAGPAETIKKRESLKEFIGYGKNTVTLKSDVPLYRRDGFRYHSPEELKRYPNRSYLGTPVSHSIRWQFTRSGKLKMGFTCDKDAGEPFMERTPRGYDFCSPYFCMTNLGIVRQITVGNLKAGFGRGLLIDCGMGMGKRNSASRPGSAVNGITPHASAAEYGFFQGGAASIGRDRFWATVMLAHTPFDATVKTGTGSQQYISSFKTDGYHRTPLEFSRRHNELMNSGLVHLNWHENGITLGVTALSEQLSLPTAEGAHFNGFSSDFSIRRPRLSVWSELAVSMNGGVPAFLDDGNPRNGFAGLCNALLRLPDGYDMNVIARYYSANYYTLHASALADGGVGNEAGMLVSLKKSTKKSAFDGYMDLFCHMEPTSTCSVASVGFEMDGRFDHVFGNGDQLLLTGRLKVKQKDCSKSGQAEPNTSMKFRAKCDHSLSPQLTLHGQADFTTFKIPCQRLKKGAGLSGNLQYRFLWMGMGWFCTESYDCAVRTYERGLRYSFNNMTLSGHGLRMYAMVRLKTKSTATTLDMKLGSTCYFDRSEISSSAQKIAQSHKEDLSILLIQKF